MALPNGLVIGVAKAGTTSLYYYLGQHPDVAVSRMREPRFLHYAGSLRKPEAVLVDPFPITSLEEYQAQFAGCDRYKARVDITPTYLMHPEQSILGIQEYVPDAKLIAIYRQPADRGYSSYLMRVRMGDETMPTFAEALQAEEDGKPRLNGLRRTYFDRGLYARRTRAFLDAFPRERFLFLLYDDLVADPAAVLREVFRFLEVDEGFRPDFTRRYNAGSWPRSLRAHRVLTSPNAFKKRIVRLAPESLRRIMVQWLHILNQEKPPRLDPELRTELTLRYKEDILALQAMIDRDLSGWLEVE
jgi:hypothetical protein